jgi:AAA domain (dynein-related subfamily)
MSNSITTRSISPNQAKRSIRKCINIQQPVFLWGPAGIGKSDIVAQIAKELNRPVIDIRLSLWEPTDIKGIPYYNPKKNTMEWAPPSELPTDPDSNAVLFLDELNSAPQATQAAAYQLTLGRRIGTYELPPGVSVVAAGNRDGDKGVTYRMPAPLANRMIHLEVKHDFEDWLEWAVTNKIHEQVVGYISHAKGDLYDFDPKSASRAFATPRSWSFVSKLLGSDDLDDKSLTDLIAGAVGEGIAIKFMAHRKVAKQMPKAEDVLSGKVKKFDIKEISAMYSVTISLCYELQTAFQKKSDKFNEMSDYFFGFLMDNFPTEIVVMGAKTAIASYGLPFNSTKLKNFDRFFNNYGKYVITALEK